MSVDTAMSCMIMFICNICTVIYIYIYMEPTAEDFQIKLWDMKSTSLVQQFVQQNRCLTRVCLH